MAYSESGEGTEPSSSSDSAHESKYYDTTPRPLPSTPRLRTSTLASAAPEPPPLRDFSPSANNPVPSTPNTEPKPLSLRSTSSTIQPPPLFKTPKQKPRSTAHLLASLAAQSTPFRALQDAVMQGRAFDWQIEQYWEVAGDLDKQEAERIQREEDATVVREMMRRNGTLYASRDSGNDDLEEGEVIEDHIEIMTRGRGRRRSSVGRMDRWYQGYLRGESPGGEVNEVTILPYPGPQLVTEPVDQGTQHTNTTTTAVPPEADNDQNEHQSASPELGNAPSHGTSQGPSLNNDGGSEDTEDWISTDEDDELYEDYKCKRRSMASKLVEGIKLKTKLRSKRRPSTSTSEDSEEEAARIERRRRSGSLSRSQSRERDRSQRGHEETILVRTEQPVGEQEPVEAADEDEGEQNDDVVESIERDEDDDVVMSGTNKGNWKAEDAVEGVVLSERIKSGYRFVD